MGRRLGFSKPPLAVPFPPQPREKRLQCLAGLRRAGGVAPDVALDGVGDGELGALEGGAELQIFALPAIVAAAAARGSARPYLTAPLLHVRCEVGALSRVRDVGEQRQILRRDRAGIFRRTAEMAVRPEDREKDRAEERAEAEATRTISIPIGTSDSSTGSEEDGES